MSISDNYTRCQQFIRQRKWKKAEKIIVSAPEVLQFCFSGEDSILIAALKCFCDSEFLQFLINCGCDVNSKDDNGNTPLYHACINRSYIDFPAAKDSPNYQTLFRSGAKLTLFEELMIAGNAPSPDWKAMQQILRYNPDVVRMTDENGDTLLSRNANVEYCELFDFFLQSAKWDLNLLISPESGSILGKIWESAYLVNSTDSPETVKKRQYMKTVLIPKLKSMGAEKLPEEELFEYIVSADISALQKMLQKNPGMINAMYHGETVFTAICDAVCRFGLTQYDDIIELFIRAGADVDSSSYWGMNALHWAMKFGNEELEKKFIALGVDVNAKDNKGNTPLHWSMECCHYWPAALLEAGADVNAVNNDGETPLDWAQDGWTPEHTRQFRKALKQMGALSGKEIRRGACVCSLEELLVIVVKTGLHRRIALIRLCILTVAFTGGTAAFDIGHY